MRRRYSAIFRSLKDDRGVLTFEWILLLTLLVIGIVGGVSAVRDAVISELGDVTAAAVHVDQSYSVSTDATGWGNAFSFEDALPTCPGEQNRPASGRPDQGPVGDCGTP
ncbi:MAG: hypothetical protein GYA33_03350 [Thermogutta sp.]|nr:hypothetical protein [Thermogutta sp.]